MRALYFYLPRLTCILLLCLSIVSFSSSVSEYQQYQDAMVEGEDEHEDEDDDFMNKS